MNKFVVPQSVFDQPRFGAISSKQTEAAKLLDRTEIEQRESGYFYTLHEILQQPATWLETGKALASMADGLMQSVAGIRMLILTGSGSSEYAGDCVRLPLQNRLLIPTQTAQTT